MQGARFAAGRDLFQPLLVLLTNNSQYSISRRILLQPQGPGGEEKRVVVRGTRTTAVRFQASYSKRHCEPEGLAFAGERVKQSPAEMVFIVEDCFASARNDDPKIEIPFSEQYWWDKHHGGSDAATWSLDRPGRTAVPTSSFRYWPIFPGGTSHKRRHHARRYSARSWQAGNCVPALSARSCSG